MCPAGSFVLRMTFCIRYLIDYGRWVLGGWLPVQYSVCVPAVAARPPSSSVCVPSGSRMVERALAPDACGGALGWEPLMGRERWHYAVELQVAEMVAGF